MKKLTIGLMALAMFLAAINIQAQGYTVDISGQKKVVIKELNRVSVEAYDGNKIEINTDSESNRPERAEGLKALSARGEDNTGLGLNVETSGDEVTILQAARRVSGKYIIKVPKGMTVKIEHTGSYEGGQIEVYKISKELEVSGRYNSIYMEDVTGPALVNTVYGGIEAKFSSLSQSGPTSIVSVYGDVDITLPENAKANLKIKTPYGEAFSDLKIDFEQSGGMKKMSSTVEGKLNGGGVELDLQASYNNVYLRKK